MSIKLYNARDVWNLDKEAVWNLPDGKMRLLFDDGTEILTTNRATIFSYYFGVFHRLFPKTPLLPIHHLGNKELSRKSDLKILEAGLFSCRAAYENGLEINDKATAYFSEKSWEHVDTIDTLKFIAFQTINLSFNDFTSRLKSYVSSTSILDYVEVANHPVIKAAKEKSTAKP